LKPSYSPKKRKKPNLQRKWNNFTYNYWFTLNNTGVLH
jgi:hypothetical protein